MLRLNRYCIRHDEQIWPNKLNHLYFHFVILKLGSDTETKKDQLRHFSCRRANSSYFFAAWISNAKFN